MSFFKISPIKFIVVGTVISLLSILGYYHFQTTSLTHHFSIKSVKSPVSGIHITNWFSGNADKSGQTEMFVNGMGMKFKRVPGLEVAFGIHEVTIEQFRFFAESVGLKELRWLNRITRAGLSQEDNHPVVNISWEEANRFCEWLSKQEGIVFRLPTDYEWSLASGIGDETSFLSPSQRSKETPGEYYWGKPWQTDKAVGNYADKSYESMTGTPECFNFDDRFPGTAPVGSFPANKIGIYDMGGNVSEWVYDWYRGRDEYKTVRGASYQTGITSRDDHRKGFRGMNAPDFRSEQIGFRIVAEISDKLQPAILVEADPLSKPAPASGGGAIEGFQDFVVEASIAAPSTAESIASEPLPYLPALSETKRVRVTYSGKDGINLREDRTFSSGNILGALVKQSAVPLIQIGEDSNVDTETWVKVEITGWIPTKNSTHTYLKDQGDGTWKVIWSKPGDRYVAMRSGLSSDDDPLLCKVSYNTIVEELDSKSEGSRHYIQAKLSGWAVKRNTSRSYIADIK